MSRRFSLFCTLAAIFAIAVWSVPAGAAIPGSAHDVSSLVGSAGACAACHIPHGGGAQRLWPTTAGSGGRMAGAGVVGTLCASCHDGSGGYAAQMSNAESNLYVYGAQSHGRLMAITNLPWGTSVTGSGLPYANQAGNFECTSCHDVHNDTAATNATGFRPFLRDNINGLCARCHTSRHFVSGTLSQGGSVTPGAWGGNARVGTLNPGSHPVGTDITNADNFGGGSVIVIASQMRVLASAGAGGWSLGGHLTANASGGVTCVSCHAVHGGQIDAQDNTSGQVSFTAFAPNANYLAMAQTSTSGAWTNNRSVANGQGGFNALCEGCHGGGNNPTGFTDTTHNVNPGGSATWSHPIDTFPANYNAGVVGFGDNANTTGLITPFWPVGGGMTAGANVAPIPICESCHVPHPAAELANAPGVRVDVRTGAAAYILRDQFGVFCNNCHSGTIGGHHPIGMSYTADGVSYLSNAGTGTQTLSCGTCHSRGGAHNWATAAGNVGLDNNWLPSNNGRTGTQSTEMYNANMSKTCMDCHYGMDGNAASLSPTLGTSATAAVGLETAFNTLNTSMGTHYIGLIHTGDNTWRSSPLVNIFSTTQGWLAQVTGYDNLIVANGYARFGGTSSAPVLVCESCHEIEPDRNVGGGIGKHLLLAAYGEGYNGDDVAARGGTGTDAAPGRDILCEACHGVPGGTHALTGQTVSRTGVALETDNATLINGAARSWLRASTLGFATWTKGTDAVSCDSCHQPHDANTASYTFMLDAPATLSFPIGGSQTTVGAGTVDTNNPAATADYAITTYATPVLQGRGGSFTGFCDQCHTYAY